MGRQIIKKDDGTFALWSSITDSFLLDGVTDGEIKEFFIEEAVAEALRMVDDVLIKIDEGRKPYHQFTMTYEEAQELMRIRRGEVEED